MNDEERLFALVMAVLSNSSFYNRDPLVMAKNAVFVATTTMKELNDTANRLNPR